MYLKHLKTTTRTAIPQRPARLQRRPSILGPHSSRCLVDVQWTTQHLNLRLLCSWNWPFLVEDGGSNGGSNWSNSKFGGDFWWLLSWSPVFHVLSREIFPWYSHRWWIPLKSPSHSRSPLVCRSQALSRSSRSPRRKPRSEILRFFHINHVVKNGKMHGKIIFFGK